ncbi:hypothetical protein JYU34_004322 [Plutella xylostella]|uniref:Reverse transcriptase domain-containing protein n=1 Tax=Plutella xylostella TaxID=51655 RepID=A0ABQ7QXP2_PLUXY|nr:hypothetical protein JYU34_004322 [Plutella xylostella]
MDTEIQSLIGKGAVQICSPSPNQYVSPTFLVDKSNGEKRFILNLKGLNKFIETKHFKLEDLRTVIKLVNPNCFMCTLDLKDAYFLLPIAAQDRKYLRFNWKSNLYEFLVLPFGLNVAPYIFTKLLKPVMKYLRLLGFMSVIYIDDLCLIGNTYEDCLTNLNITKSLLQSLGFIINYQKSNLTPSTYCKFLGFCIDSQSMRVELPLEKRLKIKAKIIKMIHTSHCTIREFARFLGLITSACPAVSYGWAHTKHFERIKYLALLKNDNYSSKLNIPRSIQGDLYWWLHNIDTATHPIRGNNFILEIFSDSSRTGWGAACGNDRASGRWTEQELDNHINFLELKAAYFGLKIFAKHIQNCEVLLRIDNTTAISYINRMGGVQFPHLNHIAQKIWAWCEKRRIFVFASYIASQENYIADAESRKVSTDIEWELADYAFSKIKRRFGTPVIDLFANRINSKCSRYISWHSDPYALAIDAFTISWADEYFYAFPPFSVILKTLRKIVNDQAEGIVVVPNWPNQPWYPLFKELLVSDTVTFKPNNKLLLSHSSLQHQLHRSLSLIAGVLSGRRL